MTVSINTETWNAAGSLVGAAGVALCLITGVARLAGFPILLGFESITIFVAGIALIGTGCLFKLQALLSR